MQTKMITRRNFLKRALSFSFALTFFTGSGYYYARFFEPKQLKKEYINLSSSKIPASFVNKKIVQFSDTHIGYHYTLAQFRELVDLINKEEPDIILFTGDLMDAPNLYEDKDKIAPILSRLEAPLGKYAIYGNHDHGGYGSEDIVKIMKEANFNLLVNESVEITQNSDSIIFIGLDDALLGRPDPSKAFSNVDNESFNILLAHEPDIFDQLTSFPFTYQLSGHSHGGQVQLPFVGPLITPKGAYKYIEGFYKDSADKELYVNRGIGTTRLPFRFLSTPELTIFTLKNE